MFQKYLIVFIICAICTTSAQNYLGDLCETDEGHPGVCKYEETCKHTTVLKARGIHSRRCPHDGFIPTICCPIEEDSQESPEDENCLPSPRIQTPEFDNPVHRVVWEKCVANQNYAHSCEHIGDTYVKHYSCSIILYSEKIKSGEAAAPREFPHMAALGFNRNNNGMANDIEWVGSGSLISDKFILTAANIVISYRKLHYALLGTVDKTDVRGGLLYTVIRWIPHKSYVSGYKQHDIALGELNERVLLSQFVRPICLPGRNIEPDTNFRLIASWRNTGDKATSSKYLLKAEAYEIDGSHCYATVMNQGIAWKNDTMICARGLKNEISMTRTCNGDIGGPLIYIVPNEEFDCNYAVYGLTSSEVVCDDGVPVMYTKVSAYLDWIVETVWPEELKKAASVSKKRDWLMPTINGKIDVEAAAVLNTTGGGLTSANEDTGT